MTLDQFLKDGGIPAIQGIDTRALTIKTRTKGTQKSVIISKENIAQQDIDEAKHLLEKEPMPSDTNLVGDVSNPKVVYHRSPSKRHVLLYDCGVKYSIIKNLWKRFSVIQVPFDFSPEKVRELDPDLILVSNGPGDPDHPEIRKTTIEAVRSLKDEYPITGICLGHQIMSLAFKGTTYKLKFGHRGANHPVKDTETGKVSITSQNHGFAVDPENPGEDILVTRMNLNDNTVEGLKHKDLPVMCVQYHPEASPGPMDSLYIFDEFMSMARSDGSRKSPEELLKLIDELASPEEEKERAGRLD
jgi:carbamoyl-phosphate synthase small subunit